MTVKKKKPEIRFKWFVDEWEERKLGEVNDVRDGTHDSPKYHLEGHPLVTSKNLSDNGLDLTEVSLISDHDFIEINKRSKVDIGDIIFGMIGTIGNPVIINRNDIAIKNVALIKKDGGATNKFLLHLLKTDIFNEYIRNEYSGSTQTFLGLSKIREFTFLLPQPKEQNKIGGYFEHLDTLITLQQRKYDKLVIIKKAMLEKMFPKDGADVPEIRFKGFKGKWDEKKIEDIAPLQRGFDLPKSDMTDGVYPVVMSNGINGWHSQFKVKAPGVVTGRSGTIGNLHYIESNFWPHNTALWVTDFKGNDPLYIYYMYQRLNLNRFGTGSGVPTLNRNDVHAVTIFISNREEQTKIGTFFQNLDNLISLRQLELDKLKTIKKSCLEKMFV
jgi:type I restriction enzyme S subunit